MKLIKFLISAIVVFALSSCHHTSEPLNIPQKYTQLNTVIAPWQKDNDLLPWKGQLHTMIINSVDDIYATQTQRFIEENPNWLQIDFSTQTIIAVRTILFAYNSWQYTSVTGFYEVNYDDSPLDYLKGDYHLPFMEYYTQYAEKDDEDESQYRIYQIAIVTDKIPSDARVHVTWSQNYKAPNVWDE